MKNNPLRLIIICTIFSVVGMTGGFMAAKQTSTADSGHGAHGSEEVAEEDDPHAGHDHGGHDHSSHAGPKISEQAAKNIGIEIADAELTNYSTYRAIPAKVEETPLTVQPITAPIGGVIKSIKVKHGSVTDGGTVVITMLRDTIARPTLTMTSELLDPERRLKGLTVEEITSIEKMNSADKQLTLWKIALERNGFWPEIAGKTYELLPKDIKALPFSAATLGELSANGLLNADLHDWFKEDKKAGNYFFEIGSLLIQGKGVDYVKDLYELGALKSTVELKAPMTAKDWDVHGIFVKPGDHVEVGTKLVSLHNPRMLHLVAHARGSEIPLLIQALEDKLAISAVPLTKNAGPTLSGLSIRNIQDDSDGKGGSVVHLEITNNPSIMNKDETGTRYRSWKVRMGARYMLRVPQKTFKEVFVLSSGAVVSDGPDRVVYVQNGNDYNKTKVVVVHEDEEVVVLSQDSELFPDDSVVNKGAFGLDIALKAGTSDAVDPHAGHNH